MTGCAADYWHLIAERPGREGAALRLHLLTGGQRIEQFVRLQACADLAAQGVSREVRGHLQSHGLTGVQARHYDGHDYMPEKRMALETLVREVCGGAKAPTTRADGLQKRRMAFGMRRMGVAQRKEAEGLGREGVSG